MSLLSEFDKREIRDAIKSVTDTFMLTPIAYHIAVEDLQVWGEDKRNASYQTINLAALVEDPKDKDILAMVNSSPEDGTFDYGDVQLTFNLEDLQALGLIAADFSFKMKAVEDYFTLRGILHKVIDIWYDGPLDAKNVLVLVSGRISQEVRANIGSNIIQHYVG